MYFQRDQHGFRKLYAIYLKRLRGECYFNRFYVFFTHRNRIGLLLFLIFPRKTIVKMINISLKKKIINESYLWFGVVYFLRWISVFPSPRFNRILRYSDEKTYFLMLLTRFSISRDEQIAKVLFQYTCFYGGTFVVQARWFKHTSSGMKRNYRRVRLGPSFSRYPNAV